MTPTPAEQLLEHAFALEAQKDLQAALAECDAALRLNPHFGEAHNLRGILLESLGRKAEAVAAYREATRINPDFKEAQANLHEAESELAAPSKFCYRHSERETRLACSRCGQPICTECARRTDVGYRCPDCLNTLRSRHFVRGNYLDPLQVPPTRPVITYVLPVLLGLIWLAQEITGGSENSYALVQQGATFGPLILRGEIWRFITSIFLHIGLMHLLFNGFALFSLGRAVEAQYGYARFAFIFLTAGYAGGLLSFAWKGLDEFSAGASGGVFGVLGAELGFLFFHRQVLGETGQERQRQLLGLIAINLFIGLTVVNVNNLAHLGGLIAGASLGYGLAPRCLPAIDKAGRNIYADQASLKRRWWIGGGSWLALALATGGALWGWSALTLSHAPPVTEATLPAAAWPVVYTSDFSGAETDWLTSNNTLESPSLQWHIANAKLHAQVEAPEDGYGGWNYPGIEVGPDFYLTVEAQQLSGPYDADYGLFFRLQEEGRYAFMVGPLQQFTVQRYYAGKWQTLIDWQQSAALFFTQPNRLTVIGTGTHYAFYINGRQVGEMEDEALRAGEVGVAIAVYHMGDKGAFEFDNFEVRAP